MAILGARSGGKLTIAWLLALAGLIHMGSAWAMLPELDNPGGPGGGGGGGLPNIISWDQVLSANLGDSPIELSASAGSGLPVSYVASPSNICETAPGVNTNGVNVTNLVIKAAGQCTVTASQAGRTGDPFAPDVVAAAPVVKRFTVTGLAQKTAQTISWDQVLSATFGGPDITLTAEASSGLAVSYSTEQGSICSIVDGNKLKINGAGPCTVTASQAGDATYAAAADVPKAFTIKQKQAELTLNVSDVVSYGLNAILAVEGGSTQGAVTFKLLSGNCGVSNTGGVNYVTPNSGTGQCTIRATMAGNDEYADVSDDATITLQKASQFVDWPNELAFTVGEETDLPPVSSGLPATYQADPESTGGCEITGQPPSRLKFNKPGRCSVTVSQDGDDRFFEIAGDTNTFTVTAPSKQQQATLTITAPNSLMYDQKVSLIVDGGSGSGAVTYQVNSGPCTVSGNDVTADSGTGTCKVTATKAGDDTYEAATTAPATIELRKRFHLVQWDLGTDFNTGESIDLREIYLTSGLPATFSVASTSQGVCAITGTNPGTLQFIAPGKCDFTAGRAGDDNYESASRTATFDVKANQTGFALTIASLSVGQEIRLSATGGQGTGNVEYQSQTSWICSVSDDNLLKGLAAGTCQVTARKLGDTDYNEVTATASVEVGLPAQNALTVVASKLSFAIGETVTLQATGGSGNGAVTFQVVSGACTINNDKLTSSSSGQCTVTAIKASDGSYTAQTSAPLMINVKANSDLVERVTAKTSSYVEAAISDTLDLFLNWSTSKNLFDTSPGKPVSFMPTGNSSEGTFAFSASGSQIVHSAGKGDLQVTPTSAARPDQLPDPYVRTPGSFDVWVDGRVSWRNGADDAGGLDHRTFIAETGVDYLLRENLLIGLSVRMDNADSTMGGEGGEIETLGWLVGPYVVWEITPRLTADAQLRYGGSRNDISVKESGADYDGSYDSTRWHATAGLRGRMELGSVTLEPGLRGHYYREATEAFTLSNGGGTVGKVEMSFLRLSLDPRLTYLHMTEEGTSITPFLSPQLAAEWKETSGGKEDEGWDVFGVVQGGLSIATEDFFLSGNLSASGIGRDGALSYSAGASLTIPLN